MTRGLGSERIDFRLLQLESTLDLLHRAHDRLVLRKGGKKRNMHIYSTRNLIILKNTYEFKCQIYEVLVNLMNYKNTYSYI